MKKYLFAILGSALLVFMVYGFKLRTENHKKFKEYGEMANTEKKSFLALYDERAKLLVEWEKRLVQKIGESHFPSDLKVGPLASPTAKNDLKSFEDAKRFDFEQNQISQKLSLYLNSKPALMVKPPNLEKIEEAINRSRVKYHKLSFEAKKINERFWLNEKNPIIFEPEKILHDKGLL